MHRKFLDYLVDPVTREALQLDRPVTRGETIERGILRSSQHAFPIIDGVPRFACRTDDHYADSFAYQWKKWPTVQFESQNVGRPMEGHTRRMWERITGLGTHLTNQVILD